MVLPNLAFFYFFLISREPSASPVGNRNIIIIFVWILWWFLLIALMVPFASRIWCTVCPIPFFGEWYQRRALIGARVGKPGVGRNRMWGLNKRWPKALSNIWLQNIGFLLLCTFSVALLTRPFVSVFVLGGTDRAGHGSPHRLPAAGLLQLRLSDQRIPQPLLDGLDLIEVRSSNRDLRQLHGQVLPRRRRDRLGLPVERLPEQAGPEQLLRSVHGVPQDLRPRQHDDPGAAVLLRHAAQGVRRGLEGLHHDQLALAYSINLLGPWGTIKDWANPTESGMWGGFALYAGSLWGLALLVVPAIFYVAVASGPAPVRGDERR